MDFSVISKTFTESEALLVPRIVTRPVLGSSVAMASSMSFGAAELVCHAVPSMVAAMLPCTTGAVTGADSAAGFIGASSFAAQLHRKKIVQKINHVFTRAISNMAPHYSYRCSTNAKKLMHLGELRIEKVER